MYQLYKSLSELLIGVITLKIFKIKDPLFTNLQITIVQAPNISIFKIFERASSNAENTGIIYCKR